MTVQSINPTTGKVIREYEEITVEQEDRFLLESDRAFRQWRRTPFAERSSLMKSLAALLRERRDIEARLMAEEMGKPFAQGEAEAEKCAWVCDYYAEHAERFLSPEFVHTDASESFVTFQPLGILLAVMPWNFPFWQVFRAAVPALMAGNVVVLKHASNVFGCALAIEDLFRQGGFPAGCFRTLLAGAKRVDRLIAHPLVKAVTITGSTAAGQAVAAKAGMMLKKSVLELGGSDAYIVLDDARLEETVETCVNARLINNGQSCIAAKRFIVVAPLKKKFEEGMVESMKRRKVGDPLDPTVAVGPMARHHLRDELHDQVRRSVAKGGRLLVGGEVPQSEGAFYPPTVLTDVKKGMAAYDEETFGPVAAIIEANNEADAVRIANDSIFGLGAAVFTEDVNRGKRIAAGELEAGSCFVNAFVKSDPRLPFGGVKLSGYGRELSHFGIKEFVNIKTVYIR